jgi:hypothetical protein
MRPENGMVSLHGPVEPQTFVFDDDGLVPNNRLPVLRYRLAIDLTGDEPERILENLFSANGWGDHWRNGIYDYLHYHATVHEALGIARGHAHVRLAAIRDASWNSPPAMSRSCRRAPATNACSPATTSASSAPIRPARKCRSRGQRRTIIARR